MSDILRKVAQLKNDKNWFLEAERIGLAVFVPEILSEKFVEQMRLDEVNRYMEFRHNPPDFTEQIKFINDNLNDPRSLYLAITDRQSKRLIGSVRLSDISSLHGKCNLGILLADQEIWGKGIATEVIATVTDFAHSNLMIRRITAGCYEPNIGSKKAFLKAGYELEGELRSSVVTGTKMEPGEPVSEFILGSVRNAV